MQSMTGYGSADASENGRFVSVELKTVNHRYLDIAFRMPKSLVYMEDALRQMLNNSALKRGHVEVRVEYKNERVDAQNVSIEGALLERMNEALESNAHLLRAYRQSTVVEVLTACDALRLEQLEEDNEAVLNLTREAMEKAINTLLVMRKKEGKALKEDLLTNLAGIEGFQLEIVKRAPEVPLLYKKRLESRLTQWLAQEIDTQRLAQEVAIMADRCAIDEELSRLESHFFQFKQTLNSPNETGRKLDFLLQEINREINTIGSKANDAIIAQAVVEAKCLVEKLREQVQNIV